MHKLCSLLFSPTSCMLLLSYLKDMRGQANSQTGSQRAGSSKDDEEKREGAARRVRDYDAEKQEDGKE